LGIISLIKPLKKYEDFVNRASTYENLLLRNKAIQIMTSAVKQQHFRKEEISSGYFYLGLLYSKTKEYKLASDRFHRCLELMKNEKFRYNSNLKKAIESFIKIGDKEKAMFWLNNLLERQSYDKKFKKLAKLKNNIE